jgi:hypothetical protein
VNEPVDDEPDDDDTPRRVALVVRHGRNWEETDQ